MPLETDHPEPAASLHDEEYYSLPRDLGVKKLAEMRPVVLVPRDVTNVARGKPVASSSPKIVLGDVESITDGDKRPKCFSIITAITPWDWVRVQI